MSGSDQKFVHSTADEAVWSPGLRAVFEYRDLGIRGATDGGFQAHVIRHVGAEQRDDVQNWHAHELDFQLVFVLRGTAVFEFEGHGEHTMRPGDCVLQPPGIRHREIFCSDDYEVLEIVAPADFKTVLTDPPEDS